jgi:hypothetical protein
LGAPVQRDNHLGNVDSTVASEAKQPVHFVWRIPENLTGTAVLRIRYNVTQGDFKRLEKAEGGTAPRRASASSNGTGEPLAEFMQTNARKLQILETDQTQELSEWEEAWTSDWAKTKALGKDIENFNLFWDYFHVDATFNDKEFHGMVDDPYKDFVGLGALEAVQAAAPARVSGPLRLNVNTAQFPRTFEDRTHTFRIKPRPPEVSSSARIVNYNVRGRRGNIVQVYPSVEYDFGRRISR